MTLRTQILAGLRWIAGAKFGGQMITWTVTIVVMRVLEPADYGLQAMASVFIGFFLLLAELGLGPALVQKTEISQEKLQQVLGVILLVNCTLFLLLNAAAPAIAAFMGDTRLETVIRILSLQFPLLALAVIPEAQLQRKLDYKLRAMIELGTAMVGSIVTLSLALGGAGVWALILGNLGAVVAKVVVMNIVSPFRHWPSFSLVGMRGLLTFGGSVTTSSILWFVFWQADILIAGKMLGKEVLGHYAVAMHLASLPVQRVSAIINKVAFPAFSRFKEEKQSVSNEVVNAIAILSFFGFPLLWGLSSVAPELIAVVLGEGWSGAILPLQLLAVMMPFRLIIGFLPAVTDALGHPQIGIKNVVLACAVMPAAFYFGSRWGAIGVAAAWVAVYPIVLMINAQRMLRVFELHLSDMFRVVLPAVMASAAMYVAVIGARMVAPASATQTLSLTGMIIAGAATYVATSSLCNRQLMRCVVQFVLKK